MPTIVDSAGNLASYRFQWICSTGQSRRAKLVKSTPSAKTVETVYILSQTAEGRPITCSCSGYRFQKSVNTSSISPACFEVRGRVFNPEGDDSWQ